MPESDENLSEKLARQGIEEMTAELRAAPLWGDLREDLAVKGYEASTLLLAFMGETGDGEQHGALVTQERRVLRFVREPIPDHPRGRKRFATFRDVTGDPAMMADFQRHIDVALRMFDEMGAPSQRVDPSESHATERRERRGLLRALLKKLTGR